jgi:transposase
MFYDFLGPEQAKHIRLAVMDMWKPFRNATEAHAPHAAILYDKFHVLRHLNEAMDKVRKSEYKRLTNRADRKYIKGQKYVLLSHRENLSPEKKQRLELLLAANKRLNTAYVLKEQFAQLWEYRREAWARKFFDEWRRSLRWQRLRPFEEFAELIERHWDGIAAYCRPENKVALGFVEGLNNKIRVIQLRCYGLRDEDYLHPKILTCTLLPLPRH